MYNCKNAGFHQHYGSENRIENNIFANNFLGQLQATRIEKHNAFSFKHNIILSSNDMLFVSNWTKVQMNADSNSYWFSAQGEKSKVDSSKAFIQSTEPHSLIADPILRKTANGTYQVSNVNMLKQIGFRPDRYAKAGVYGDLSWTRKSKLDPGTIRKFDEAVKVMISGLP